MQPVGKRPLIYLIGTAGHPNYGDELITAAWLRFLARVLPDADVWLDTPRPGPTAVLMDGLHPGLRCVDTLFHACWNAPDSGPAEILAFGEAVISDPGLLPREATGVENLSRVDLVHVLGGGYINALWPRHLALLGAARGIATRHGARTALTGAGLFPLVEGSRQPLGQVLADFDLVDVRDSASLDALRPLVPHATQTGDDALLGLDGPVYRHSPAHTLLSIQSDLLEIPLPALADYVVRTLRSWRVDQQRVTLVEGLPPGDAVVMQLLEPHLPHLELLPFSDLWRNGFPSSRDHRWISTRFHPHLMAAAAGAWGVAVPISQGYYANKLRSLTALGSGWDLAPDLGEPLPPRPPVHRPFNGQLAELKAGKTAVATRVVELAADIAQPGAPPVVSRPSATGRRRWRSPTT